MLDIMLNVHIRCCYLKFLNVLNKKLEFLMSHICKTRFNKNIFKFYLFFHKFYL